MTKHIITGLLLAHMPCLLFADKPAQFKAWGGAVPQKLVRQATVPSGFKRVQPKTNLKAPEYSSTTRKRGYAIFASPVFEKVFSKTQAFAEQLNKPVRAFATAGEYVSLKFSVRALTNLQNISLKLGAVRSKKGALLPSENFDLRIVRNMLCPGEKEKEYYLEPRFLESISPNTTINIKSNSTRTFWITSKIPDNAKTGKYQGIIDFKAKGRQGAKIKLQLLILPFKLAEIDPYKNINFSILSNQNDPRIGSWSKYNYQKNLYKQFVDMKEHGMNATGYFHCNPYFELKNGKINIDFSRPGFNSYYSMDYVMEQYKKAGLTGAMLYQKGPKNWALWAIKSRLKFKIYTPEFDKIYTALAKAVSEEIKKKNWPEFIFFIGDEPGCHADRLKRDLYYGKIIKKVAPNILTSNFFNFHSKGSEDWRYLAPVSDILCAHSISAYTLREAKKLGYKEVWSYATASGGANWSRDRVAYGFHPWAFGLKGVTQFIYQTGGNNPYDRLNQLSDGHFFYAYPSPQGPVPAIHWEAIRQGTYDYRYLLTLKSLIDKAKSLGKATASAEQTLNDVITIFKPREDESDRSNINRGLNSRTLDIYRWKLAKAIISLKKAVK